MLGPSRQPSLAPEGSPVWVKVVSGLRLLVLVGGLLLGIAIASRQLGVGLLTAALGPTAYMFAAHPDTEAARVRNAVVGHSTAVASGLASLALFGLFWSPLPIESSRFGPMQDGAVALAVGLTLLVLELTRSHHAPAAATAVLVASGLADPGPKLVGLVLGLAAVAMAAPLLRLLPLAALVRRLRSEEDASRSE